MHINGGNTSMNFDNVYFRNNNASAIGGALILAGGEARISNSTFFNNSSNQAAAIYIPTGSLRVTNSTFSGNSSSSSGVIVSNERPVIIRNSTIVNNTGIGLSKSSGTLILGNTIVAGNTSFNLFNSNSAIQTSGGNLIGNNSNAGANFPAGSPNANSDYVGTNSSPINPLLGALTIANGGETPTHALLMGSPAIDKGNNCVLTASGCGAGDLPAALIYDQRGAGFLRSFGGTVDIGAFEYQTPLAIVTNDADSDAGSLRQVILDANPGDTIVFDPAFFNQARTITLGSSIVIDKNLTINGTGANLLTIDGGAGDNNIFETLSSALTLSDVTLQGGGNPNSGFPTSSAILAFGGTLILSGVIVQNNHSTFGAGTIYFLGGANHQIINSTISNNTNRACAGFQASSGATVFVTNSTISGNNAAFGNGVKFGGGICSFDTNTVVTLRNSTISNNNAVESGGGIFVEFNGTVNIGNTIVAGNTAPFGADIYIGSGTVQTVGNNLIGNNTTVEALFPVGNPNGNGDFVGTNTSPLSALLAPLGNYGGNTPTHALFPNSPAINNGNGAIGGTPLADQRGAARVGAVDIGAFEYNVGINQTSLPSAYTGQNYDQNLTAFRLEGFSKLLKQNSFAPFTFEIIPIVGESLPNGLILAANGNITGMATTIAPFTFTVKATDADGMAGVQKVSMDVFAPTAASVVVSGKVLAANGRSISKATVSLVDSSGNTRTTLTNQFGAYRFTDVAVGEVYTFSVSAKQYSFVPQVILVNEEMYELNFTSHF